MSDTKILVPMHHVKTMVWSTHIAKPGYCLAASAQPGITSMFSISLSQHLCHVATCLHCYLCYIGHVVCPASCLLVLYAKATSVYSCCLYMAPGSPPLSLDPNLPSMCTPFTESPFSLVITQCSLWEHTQLALPPCMACRNSSMLLSALLRTPRTTMLGRTAKP